MQKIEKGNYDSMEEVYFTLYLEELLKHEYIIGYDYNPCTFELSEQVKYNCVKYPLPKTKPLNFEDKELLPRNTYTPDFSIYWTSKAIGIFVENTYMVLDKSTYFMINGMGFSHIKNIPSNTKAISFIDVKPNVALRFAKSASTLYTFPIEQKWVMDKYGVYVQKVIPIGNSNCLFAKTFTPDRYLFTDVTMVQRNIKHKTMSIFEYTDIKNKSYEQIRARYKPLQGLLFD